VRTVKVVEVKIHKQVLPIEHSNRAFACFDYFLYIQAGDTAGFIPEALAAHCHA